MDSFGQHSSVLYATEYLVQVLFERVSVLGEPLQCSTGFYVSIYMLTISEDMFTR